MKANRFVVASLIVLACMSASLAQQVSSLAPFTSIELRGGGKVFFSHGAGQRVTLLKGSSDLTRVAVSEGKLIIENCRLKCPRGYQLEIEIVAPNISGISVSNGGLLQSRGDFPPRAAISAAVDNGGTIDIRTMNISQVAAAVNNGGRILVKPQTGMVASVVDGGAVTYWGNARVTTSIQRGGVVERGSAQDLDKPMVDSPTSVPALPAVPSVHTIRPVRNQRK